MPLARPLQTPRRRLPRRKRGAADAEKALDAAANHGCEEGLAANRSKKQNSRPPRRGRRRESPGERRESKPQLDAASATAAERESALKAELKKADGRSETTKALKAADRGAPASGGSCC